MSLRFFLEECRLRGEVVEVERRLSSKIEAARELVKHDGGPVVILKDVNGKGISVIAGLASRRERVYQALRVNEHTYYRAVSDALRQPLKPAEVEHAAFKEVDLGSSLEKLPILTYYEKDPGPYITAGVVVAKDIEEGFQNASIHRLQLLSTNRMAIRMVPRHLYAIYSKAARRGLDLDIAILIGLHPAVLFAASCSPPLGVDEVWIANRLLNGRLEVTSLEDSGLKVPADAEIVIEGVIKPDEEAIEGPFVDVTGTYDEAREQPVVRVKRVYARRGAMYHAILPGGWEHRLLMGMPKEVAIWESVRMVVPEVRAVRLTPGGFNWLHAVVAVKTQWEGEGKNAILAAMSGHPSLKHVVVVDEDVDVDDPVLIEKAIALNVQGDEDIIIVRKARGSSLDPSSGKTGVTCKVGVDATKKKK
ncbi:MAG: UbiD family decarboxylase [Candidatus Nezhaarchaeota archaeon]|nr:UbiD family decarboxylase [Candidatus Nezhaarchaeota archaeon]